MTGRLTLEVFELATALPEPALHTDLALEEARLGGFEAGYAAGWEDCAAAQGAEQHRIRNDIGRNLQELSFTYLEARGHVLRAVEPLLREVVAKLLPEVARRTLGPIVMESLGPLSLDLAQAPITVILNPASRDLVEPLITEQTTLPFRIVEEPTLGDSQVYLRLGEVEQQIDLAAVIGAISAALDSFFQIEQEVKLYG